MNGSMFPPSDSLAFDSQRHRLFLINQSKLEVYSTDDGKLIDFLPKYKNYRIVLSPDGRLLTAMKSTGEIRILNTDQLTNCLLNHHLKIITNYVQQFESNHSIFACTMDKGYVYRLNFSTGKKQLLYSCKQPDCQWIDQIHTLNAYTIFVCVGSSKSKEPHHLLIFRNGDFEAPYKLYIPNIRQISFGGISFENDRLIVCDKHSNEVFLYHLEALDSNPRLKLLCASAMLSDKGIAAQELLEKEAVLKDQLSITNWPNKTIPAARTFSMRNGMILECTENWNVERSCGVIVYDSEYRKVLFEKRIEHMKTCLLTDDHQLVISDEQGTYFVKLTF